MRLGWVSTAMQQELHRRRVSVCATTTTRSRATHRKYQLALLPLVIHILAPLMMYSSPLRSAFVLMPADRVRTSNAQIVCADRARRRVSAGGRPEVSTSRMVSEHHSKPQLNPPATSLPAPGSVTQ